MGSAPLAARLIDSLYAEALLLTDETRRYFEDRGSLERAALPPDRRVHLACEALRGATRLMQAVAWLVIRKAREAAALGDAPAFDPAAMVDLPEEARRLLAAGADLYDRVRRIDQTPAEADPSPARSLFQRLERSF